ncbi:hypothetical protein HUT03_04300 [Candidatus Liberibacter africanus]|uniref:Uncharacterized protein n=1 Tax=Candidatus Liberibacter africanus PTSAPSY TaxID=1277257 RepID=A0A0G3I7G8_LIBAF|nr:hypothetical protein [Candidatus Liberibacter africanus]AKK20468.1 hypothetical protein G293_04220 [Candidatus Liberibacter africanus PTSAPSY]QTP64185.1 hypothetical protein HUT03_04300 [Candidatus Liberibacter africanus]
MKISNNKDDYSSEKDILFNERKNVNSQEDRKKRLASMLRKNLHRRKEQARLKD